MKLKIILPIFFLMVLSLSVFVSAECTDSDGGLDYYTAGMVTLNGETEYDTCGDDGKLVGDRYCYVNPNTGLEEIATGGYNCPKGCLDGACLPDNYTNFCLDSDGGKNSFKKGFTSEEREGVSYHSNQDICVISDGFGSYKSSSDNSCEGSTCYVKEYFCEMMTSVEVMNVDFILCSQGCENGQCTSASSATCTDSDGGLKSDVFGYTNFKLDSFELKHEDACALVSSYDSDGTPSGWQGVDSCSGENCYVEEAFCRTDENGNFIDADADQMIKCSAGCNNGQCTSASSATCTDSDGGKSPTILGKAEIEGAGGQGDWCDYSKGENKIYEAYCINDTAYTTILMDCPTDKPYCNKGKCSASKPKCTEDDGGKNPLILGTTFPSRMADHTGSTDYCQITSTGQPPESGECSGSDCSLREFFCVEGSPDEFYNDIPCPSGCKDGVCSKIEPTEETGPIKIVEETVGVKEEIKVVKEDCNGCILDKKCYPIGYRMENTYCDNQQFSNQKEADTSCNNNFECSTNLCIDNECVSSGFWQKIIRFFKNLFG